MKRWTLQKRSLATVVVFLVGVVTCLAQTTIHVPTDVATIQGAIDAAQNGDIVLVSAGVYNENLDFKSKAITVTTGAQSFNDATTTILNGTQEGPVVTFKTGEPPTAVLNGFTIQNGHTSPPSGSPGGGIFIDNASPTISNNIVTKNYGCGVLISNSASPVLQANDVIGNLFPASDKYPMLCHSSATVGGAAGTGIFIGNAGNVKLLANVIEENVTDPALDSIGGTTGAGVVVNGGVGLLLQDNIIRNNHSTNESGFVETIGIPVDALSLINNLFYGNTSRYPNPVQLFISGPYTGVNPTLKEINNTVYGGGQEIVLPFGPSTIANNIFVNDTSVGLAGQGSGLFCGSPESQIDIEDNDIFNTGNLQDGGCTLGSGNISRDPGLRDPSNGDYHEQMGSPTITAGNINAPQIPQADLDQKARTVCGTIDMGAYELRPHPRIALTSSANPTPGGSSITFSTQLIGNCNVPTGTVTFLDGGKAIGTGALNGLGVATLTTALLVVGQHNLTASYPGDFNFDDSTSDILVQVITGDPTLTSLSVSPNPAAAFSPITFQSRVTSVYGTPTGSVIFIAGANVLATAPIDGTGRATATTSTLGAGTYLITAQYTADTRFQPSTSPAVQENVIAANTSTTLSANPNPAAVTQVVTFSAAVRAGQTSTRIPSGTVILLDGSTILGTTQLNTGGIANFSIGSLSFGSHLITAQYGGSSGFNPSSSTIAESVILIPTTLNLTASPNPANTGQTVTLIATAMASLPGIVPLGTVTFRDGNTVLGTASVGNDGIATLTTSTLSVGSHPLQASLATNTSLGGSVSQVVNEVVQSYDFAMQPEKSEVSLFSGDWTIFPLTLTPIGGFTGTVRLSCEGLPDHAQCVFPDGDSVSLSNGGKTVRFSLNTSDVYGYGKQVGQLTPAIGGSGLVTAFAPAFGVLCFAGLRRRWFGVRLKVLILLSLMALFGFQGCSGKLPGTAAPGTSIVTITGTSNGSDVPLVHTVTVQLVVTQ